VHVVGAGVMGGDIAAWSAKGFEVTLQDREQRFIDGASAARRRCSPKGARREQAPGRGRALKSDLDGVGVAEPTW
jgi:3-hydroxyacyl-CoA dehydrogenase/enoyl-CoA hydratase/3-hydroxybutyryl-CoA epimerase